MTGLGELAGAVARFLSSQANAASGYGAVVVGESDSGAGREAFRWTESGEWSGLGIFLVARLRALPETYQRTDQLSLDIQHPVWAKRHSVGHSTVEWLDWTIFREEDSEDSARAVSADGSLIVGFGETGVAITEAFLWDASNGMRSIEDLLIADGVDLTGWRLEYAHDISADGHHIVGIGTNPDGFTQGWMVSSVPEPSTFVLVLIGCICTGIGYWRSSRRPCH